MNAKQKAIEICQNMAYTSRFSSFNEGRTLPLHIAKQCAIHCVNEMIEQFNWLNKRMIGVESAHFLIGIEIQFYNNVKTEIEKL